MRRDRITFESHKIFKDRDEFFKEIDYPGMRWFQEYLSTAFDCRGYVAGGAAVRIAQHKLMGSKRFDDLSEAIMTLFMRGRRPVDPTTNQNVVFEDTVIGDIDVFFPSSEHYARFIMLAHDHALTKSGAVVMSPSPTGAAMELTYNKQSKIQAVARYTAPIEQQLSCFDLVNSMVTFDGSTMMTAEGWRELDERHLVHVQNWKCDWVINRISKYIMKHGYNTVTRDTATTLFKYFKEEIEKAATGEYSQLPKAPGWNSRLPGRRFKGMTVDSMVYEFSKFVKSLDDSDLVQFSSYVPDDAYDVAFVELARRSKVR